MSLATTRDCSVMQCINHAQISTMLHSHTCVQCVFYAIEFFDHKGSHQHVLCDSMPQSIGEVDVWYDGKNTPCLILNSLRINLTINSKKHNWLVFHVMKCMKNWLDYDDSKFRRRWEDASKHCLLRLFPMWQSLNMCHKVSWNRI